MKKILFLLCTSLVFFAGCKKDDDDDDSNNNPCKVSSVQYYSGGQVSETATYTYTGNQITKVQLTDVNYTFVYNGNNVTKRNYFLSAGASPELYDTISYNSDGTVSKIESYLRTNTSYVQIQRIDFNYSGGKLNKTTYNEINGGTADPFIENTYTYTGNNITSLNFINHADTTQGTVNYTYDSNPNHFKKQNNQTWLIDLLFNQHFFDEGVFLPFAISENNVTNISNTSITYESDDRQNLKDIKIANDLFARYSYQCQ